MERVPEKSKDFSDQNTLQYCEYCMISCRSNVHSTKKRAGGRKMPEDALPAKPRVGHADGNQPI
jgi:hypothetical protein